MGNAFVSEILGTAILILLGAGVVATVLLPQKPPRDVWFAFSPQLAPLPNGTFALSFVAGPHDGTSGNYRQYLVPFDLDRTPATTTGRGSMSTMSAARAARALASSTAASATSSCPA